MKPLAKGTTIRITKADDQGGGWEIQGAMDAEWNGEAFLGCYQSLWTPRLLKCCHFGAVEYGSPSCVSNIDCMIEQLICDGRL